MIRLSLTFGGGISAEVAGDGQAQTEEGDLCSDQAKFCHCLRHSTVIDTGSGWAADGCWCNTTRCSAAKKTLTGRNAPKDHIVPFSFVKHWGRETEKKKKLQMYCWTLFAPQLFFPAGTFFFLKIHEYFYFLSSPPKQLLGTAAWIMKQNEQAINCIKERKAMIFSEVKSEL